MIIESGEGASESPWVEKYRPKRPEELIGNNRVMEVLGRFIAERNLPHQLFYGPPGTGKTSTIMAYARAIYGRAYKFMVLELNASDDRGIDIVRNNIKTFAETQPAVVAESMPLKLIILDEADAMTRDAQAALRRTMEKFSRTVRFCLICNHATNVIPALQSRCTKFKFSRGPTAAALRKVDEICEREALALSAVVRAEIVAVAQGDMRKVINTLQSIFLARQHAEPLRTVEELYSHIGAVSPAHVERVFALLTQLGFDEAQPRVAALLAQLDADVGSLLEQLCALVVGAKLGAKATIDALKALKEIEYRSSLGLSEPLLRDYLVSCFSVS